jgi:hypothetical protein
MKGLAQVELIHLYFANPGSKSICLTSQDWQCVFLVPNLEICLTELLPSPRILFDYLPLT